jgi:DNA-binding NtrC family response regulator
MDIQPDNLRVLKRPTQTVYQPDIALRARLKALHVLALSIVDQIERLEKGGGAEEQFNISEELHRFERSLISNALQHSGGRLRQAARLLGMKVTTLHAKIRRYQINLKHVETDSCASCYGDMPSDRH